MRGEKSSRVGRAASGKVQIEFADRLGFYLKSARGISQSTVLVWTKTGPVSNLIFSCVGCQPAGAISDLPCEVRVRANEKSGKGGREAPTLPETIFCAVFAPAGIKL